MNRKNFQTWMLMISVLSWIPFAILAFYLSPQPAYVKLTIAACASFIAMLIFFLKMEG